MGELRVIGRTSTVMVGDVVKGDIRLTWRKDNAEEINIAETTFNEYIIKGWIAIGQSNGTKKQIFTFDPDLETIVLTPTLVGG